MIYFDYTYENPEANLALEEALLDYCEESSSEEILRFWESPTPFVVLGLSSKIHEEILLENCLKDKVPVLRRFSGGCSVVQGPGCFNYCLILKNPAEDSKMNITHDTEWIMKKNLNAISTLLNKEVSLKGTSDLTIDNIKFSGNAQRRKKSYFVFHGTILYDFDLELIDRYLKIPVKQPEYRKNRAHSEFVQNTTLRKDEILKSFASEWKAKLSDPILCEDNVDELVKTKYSQKKWNEKF